MKMRSRTFTASLGVAALALGSPAWAADRCFTDEFIPTDSASGDRVLDLEISLYADAPAGSSDRALYEEVITNFARAFYEVTNGSTYLRNVTFHTGGKQKRFAHIIWGRGTNQTERESTGSALGALSTIGGITEPFAKTWMYDFYQDAFDPEAPVQVDMVRTSALYREILGAVLAHEFGHYVFSFSEEYLRDFDAVQIPTIMSDTRLGFANWPTINYGFLNFSTQSTPGWTSAFTFNRTLVGGSSWDFITTNCDNRRPDWDTANSNIYADTGEVGRFQHQYRHVYYPHVAAAAPQPTDTWTDPITGETIESLRVELETAGTTPTKHLNFAWSDSKVELELVLDTSGSMSGTPLENVINAAQALVDEVVYERTTLGVTTFATTPYDRLPMIPIDDAADADRAKAAIGTIFVGDDTAMFWGIDDGLQKLADQRSSGTVARQAMFVLSDGNDNASGAITEAQVVSRAQQEGVRVHTLGYLDRDNSGEFLAPLQRIAYQTGGQYHFGLTNSVDIGEAMRQAYGDALTVQDIELEGTGCLLTDAGSLVDPNCTAHLGNAFVTASFEVHYTEGSDGPPPFALIAPDGSVVPAEQRIVSHSDGTQTLKVSIDGPTIEAGGAGVWTLRRQFLTTDAVFHNKRVLATPGEDDNPVELVASSRKQSYRYPEPIQINASLLLDTYIGGAQVTAEFVHSSGTVGVIDLVDDGTGSDDVANDGVYGGQLASYPANGSYDVKIVARSNGGAARILSQTVPDSSAALVPLGFEFTRQASLRVYASGVKADDHANGIDGATAVIPDFRSIPGKLEEAGDIDFFRIDVADVSTPLAVRLDEGDYGLAPMVTLYNSVGDPIAQGNVFTASGRGGVISVQVPPDLMEPTLYFSVHDLNGNAGGTYKVSAGPASSVDEPLPSALQVTSRDVRGSENNISGIEFEVFNGGTEALSDFRVVYYFETEHFQQPVLEDWWSALAEVSLVSRGSEQYAIEYDYTGFTLPAGAGFPVEAENSVGLHYADWAPWDTSNDFSHPNSADFVTNARVAIFNHLGHLIYGAVPFLKAPRTPVTSVTVFSREDKLYDGQWTAPDLYIRNNGDAISDFKVYYYFTAESGAVPVLADWDSPTAAVSLEHLGGAEYRILYDYTGYTLQHSWDQSWPTRTLVGIRYPNWSAVDRTNDISNNQSPNYAENSKIEVYDASGTRIYGTL